ncbi:MAG: Holliday junction branch migration protein RuvA [Lachnospiraceae bacterium]|nr:Holliday junction branch migration protein RuvA [Lachnospiraceae bacterium]
MYAYLKGTIGAKLTDRIIMEVGGVGYNVFFPSGRIAQLPPVGAEYMVYTYTSVREDALQLYGFGSRDDHELFCQLIAVSGVGPKAAMSLLSELSASQIRLAILGGDVKTLSKAQGIAKKTAERLIVDLKGKMGAEDMLPEEGMLPEAVSALSGAEAEAAEALTALGYPERDARTAVAKAAAEGADGTEALLKAALRFM